jgi:hypothetical protein
MGRLSDTSGEARLTGVRLALSLNGQRFGVLAFMLQAFLN